MRWWRVTAALFLVTFVCGCPRRGQRSAASESIVHSSSGVTFPPEVANFQREPEIHRYDATGRDVSMGYDLIRSAEKLMAITVYVYPAPTGSHDAVLAAEMTRILAGINAANAGVHGLERGETLHTEGTRRFVGLRARTHFSQPAAVVGVDAVVSDTHLFVAGQWFIEYRITTLERYESRVVGDVRSFLQDFHWPQAFSVWASDAPGGLTPSP